MAIDLRELSKFKPGDKVYAVICNTRPCLGIVSHQLSAGIGKDKRIEIERDQEISMA